MNRAQLETQQALGFLPDCGCGAPATTYLQEHAVDDCRSAERVDGFYCGSCLKVRIEAIQHTLLHVFLDLRPDQCVTCALPIVSLRDIIVRLVPLWVLPE